MIRTFIAIDTPDEVKDVIEDATSSLKETRADVRWEPKEKFHITLKFLGNVREETLPPLVKALDEQIALLPEFTIVYAGIGCFPNCRSPRVIWVGCNNKDGVLLQIQRAVEQATVPFGFPSEERAFHPHITLGRVKSHRNLDRLILTLQSITLQTEPVPVSEVLVMKSELRPSGSVYTVIHRIPLTQLSRR